MSIVRKKIIVYRECATDVQIFIRRCRFQSADTLECRSYYGNSPYPRLVYVALRVKFWVLEI